MTIDLSTNPEGPYVTRDGRKAAYVPTPKPYHSSAPYLFDVEGENELSAFDVYGGGYDSGFTLIPAPQPVQGTAVSSGRKVNAYIGDALKMAAQGIEAEELADDIAWLKRMGSDGVAPNLFGQGYSVCQKRIARLLSRLTPIIAGERETKAKNPLLPFAEHMLKNLRHFRQNTSGNQADAYYTFIKGEDEFWRNLENTVLALATQSPDLAGKGGAV